MNTLYYGDNLEILREYIKDESVDLIYLDPPFNSNRNYNVLFKNESGKEAESQITAFEDTWHWNLGAEATYKELIGEPGQVGRMIEAFRSFIGENQMMAYLVMMAIRLKELHRVLKPTGSLYLHCDPTASHYLKILLDTIFGAPSYRNEITWKRQSAHNDARHKFAVLSDTIFFYTKSEKFTFNVVRKPLDAEYVAKQYRHVDENGRRYQLDNMRSPNPRPNLTYDYKGYKPHANGWTVSRERMERLDEENRLHFPSSPDGRIALKRFLDENEGAVVPNLWDDILPLHGSALELLGYPTQKPVALLERILSASSNEGDVVLDPFCGCGTTIAAAQKLNREWIGIDVTHLAVGLMKLRLKDTFGMVPVGQKTASPLYLRKSSAFPADSTQDFSGSAAGGEAAKTEGDETEKHSFSANRQAEPDKTQGKGHGLTYQVIGQPTDVDGARELAVNDRYGFQWWILPLIGAKAYGSEAGKKEGKKGSDKGIDGEMVFIDDTSGKAKRVIISVKSGKVGAAHIHDLRGVIEREKAPIGVYVTLEPPTKAMRDEATVAGFYTSPGWNKDYPRLQILTVEDILHGKQVDLPPSIDTFKKAQKVTAENDDQQALFN